MGCPRVDSLGIDPLRYLLDMVDRFIFGLYSSCLVVLLNALESGSITSQRVAKEFRTQ